jgi:beta-glucosidase
VQTCAKHYIGNEQETRRTSVSSNIDDRTLHELYLWPFADAIRAGTTSLMTGHNKLNQTFASENPRVLQTILRKELGFRGYVMSDWWGTHSTSGAANSGLDMEQPGIAGALGRAYWGSTLEAAVNTGNVTKERIDDMVRHVLTPYYLLNQDDGKFPSIDPSAASVMNAAQVGFPSGPTMPQIPGRDVRGNHARLIRKMGAAGTVLLKNSGGFLPLRKTANIGVFGNDAGPPTDGLANLDYSPPPGFEFGTLTIGGGAGAARYSNLVVPLEAIHSRNPSAQVQYITSHRIILANDFRTIYPVPEVCLVFLKTFAAESWDRSSFENDWNSTQVVENVATLCPKRTVVITHSAGANTMPWASNPNVVAILAAHFPGEETGNAIVDILWGDVEPSGRLPYTIPKTPADYDIPVVSGGNLQANFTEGQLIDYRHFDSNNIEPLFEFGFGLGYTTFEIENNIDIKNIGSEKITATPAASTTVPPGGNDKLWTELVRAEITVKNSGKREGAAVPQLYLSFPKDTVPKDTPVKVLRGFDKVTLKPGERKKVTFTLKRRDLSYWNVSAQEWRIPAGKFTVSVGLSSRNLRVQKQIEIVSK